MLNIHPSPLHPESFPVGATVGIAAGGSIALLLLIVVFIIIIACCVSRGKGEVGVVLV